MQTPTKTTNLLNQDSALQPLFHLLLFGKSTAELIDEDLFEAPYYLLSNGFQNMVFSNGDFNPDDQLYIYECFWEFEKKISLIDKVSLLLNYIESEDAARKLYEEIEQEGLDCPDNKSEELVKFEIFTRLNQEILSKNKFPEELKLWLINKCERVAINGFEGSSISEENYQNLF